MSNFSVADQPYAGAYPDVLQDPDQQYDDSMSTEQHLEARVSEAKDMSLFHDMLVKRQHHFDAGVCVPGSEPEKPTDLHPFKHKPCYAMADQKAPAVLAAKNEDVRTDDSLELIQMPFAFIPEGKYHEYSGAGSDEVTWQRACTPGGIPAP